VPPPGIGSLPAGLALQPQIVNGTLPSASCVSTATVPHLLFDQTQMPTALPVRTPPPPPALPAPATMVAPAALAKSASMVVHPLQVPPLVCGASPASQVGGSVPTMVGANMAALPPPTHSTPTVVMPPVDMRSTVPLNAAPMLSTTPGAPGLLGSAAGDGVAAGIRMFNRFTLLEYKTLLSAIYADHNPEKITNIEYLLQKYAGQEEYLYQSVCSKYKVDPTKVEALLQVPRPPPVATPPPIMPFNTQPLTVSQPLRSPQPLEAPAVPVPATLPAVPPVAVPGNVGMAPPHAVPQEHANSTHHAGLEAEEADEDEEYDPFRAAPDDVSIKPRDKKLCMVEIDFLLIGERLGFFSYEDEAKPADAADVRTLPQDGTKSQRSRVAESDDEDDDDDSAVEGSDTEASEAGGGVADGRSGKIAATANTIVGGTAAKHAAAGPTANPGIVAAAGAAAACNLLAGAAASAPQASTTEVVRPVSRDQVAVKQDEGPAAPGTKTSNANGFVKEHLPMTAVSSNAATGIKAAGNGEMASDADSDGSESESDSWSGSEEEGPTSGAPASSSQAAAALPQAGSEPNGVLPQVVPQKPAVAAAAAGVGTSFAQAGTETGEILGSVKIR